MHIIDNMENITILKLEDVSYENSFCNGFLRIRQIIKNKITTISGPNGCGKSTLSKYLKKEKTEKLVLLESEINKNKTLSVLDVIKKYSKKEENYIFQKIDSFKKIIDIEKYLEYNFSKINNSYKQIVLLFSSMISDYELIILDNNLIYIDNYNKNKLLKYIKKVSKESKKTIINITNDNEEMMISDYIILIKNNEIILNCSIKKAMIDERKFRDCNLELPFMASLSLKLKYYNMIDTVYLDMNKLVNKIWK